MTKYHVSITIYNSFEVEADNKEQAEEIVRELSVYDTLDGADYNINYVEELET
jgi:uncharacterized lipoprotein YehR (DUF1307 family)